MSYKDYSKKYINEHELESRTEINKETFIDRPNIVGIFFEDSVYYVYSNTVAGTHTAISHIRDKYDAVAEFIARTKTVRPFQSEIDEMKQELKKQF